MWHKICKKQNHIISQKCHHRHNRFFEWHRVDFFPWNSCENKFSRSQTLSVCAKQTERRMERNKNRKREKEVSIASRQLIWCPPRTSRSAHVWKATVTFTGDIFDEQWGKSLTDPGDVRPSLGHLACGGCLACWRLPVKRLWLHRVVRGPYGAADGPLR